MANVNFKVPVAIDPLALVLSESIYLKYIELRHPHNPVIDVVARAIAEASPQERSFVLARAKAISELGNEVAKVAQAE